MGRIFETRKATMFKRWDKMAKAFTRIGKDIAIAVKSGGPDAFLMAFSILSLGMFAARAFWIIRRSVGLLSGLGPPAFTAMAMSFPMRVKAFAILSHRLNMVALRVSKMRPMASRLREGCERVVDPAKGVSDGPA